MTVVLAIAAVAFGIVALVLFIRRGQPVVRSFGINASRWSLVDLGVGLLIPAIAISLVFLAEWALGAITVTAGSLTGNSFAVDGLGQTAVGAALEELLFRVLLLTGLAVCLDRVPGGRWIAVIATAVLFGIDHLGNEGATLLGALGNGLGGLIYGIAFLATRSIWLPFALHLSWNVSQALIGFPVSGHVLPGVLHTEAQGDRLPCALRQGARKALRSYVTVPSNLVSTHEQVMKFRNQTIARSESEKESTYVMADLTADAGPVTVDRALVVTTASPPRRRRRTRSCTASRRSSPSFRCYWGEIEVAHTAAIASIDEQQGIDLRHEG